MIMESLPKVKLFFVRCNLKTDIEQVYVIAKHNGKVISQNLWIKELNVGADVGADLGGGCRGCEPPPEMKPSSYWLLKFVYLTGQ